jgi:hypothetical protein
MNKQPGQVTVTVETGYCPFCFRVRNLRHEERHLGTLVRTTITCESCHRTLSSTMGVAGEEPAAALPAQGEGDEPAAAEPPEIPEKTLAPNAAAKPAAPKRDAAKPAAKPKAKASAAKAQASKSRPPRDR